MQAIMSWIIWHELHHLLGSWRWRCAMAWWSTTGRLGRTRGGGAKIVGKTDQQKHGVRDFGMIDPGPLGSWTCKCWYWWPSTGLVKSPSCFACFSFFCKDLLLFMSQWTPGIHILFQSSRQLREAVSHLRSQEDQAAFDDEGECEEAPELLAACCSGLRKCKDIFWTNIWAVFFCLKYCLPTRNISELCGERLTPLALNGFHLDVSMHCQPNWGPTKK